MSIGLLALVDDISLLADDVSVATRHAGTSAGAILGDDVAVNAEKATGFHQKRELKVIWEITKGAIRNKFIILPFAFLLSYFLPEAIGWALMGGAFYLLFEGGEKIEEFLLGLFKKEDTHSKQLLESTPDNILDVERNKIKSAIITDFILSIEIIIVALGAVIHESLGVQLVAVTIVAIIATLGVYGTVALIVRMDDVGFWLIKHNWNKLGASFVFAMPLIIKALGVVGTLAMILVGGGILEHHIEFFHSMHITNFELINNFLIGLLVAPFVVAVIKCCELILEKIHLLKS